MKKIKIKSYASADMVLLAFDWYDGKSTKDFLGFAINRSPGFGGANNSWLPNRLSFNGPAPVDARTGLPEILPTDKNPIQKFMWWDANFNDGEKARPYTYTVYAVTGKPGQTKLQQGSKQILVVNLANQENELIKTHFNRAVVSSQAFSIKFIKNGKFDKNKLDDALEWLANGLGEVIPAFVKKAVKVDGAIYHLTDTKWVVPALKKFTNPLSLVYHAHADDTASNDAIATLEANDQTEFWPRTHTSIMHNKFLVKSSAAHKPQELLMGSANFTTEGLSSQANLLHVIKSPELAALYLDRKKFLRPDPTKGQTSAIAGWSPTIAVGQAAIRAFFFPEKSPGRMGMDVVVDAINNARQSVIFCIFTPTDSIMREAIFSAGDQGKMMFGLVNSISDEEPDGGDMTRADTQAKVEIYHRSRDNKDVYDHGSFNKKNQPAGFWWELDSIPQEVKSKIPPVYIHHKFILIDAETDHPIIYTGSVNMSNNSNYNNDENLLEIKNAPAIARLYLAEFMRLYEHYRARVQFKNNSEGRTGKGTLKLAGDHRWSIDDYTPGTPQYKSRITMAY